MDSASIVLIVIALITVSVPAWVQIYKFRKENASQHNDSLDIVTRTNVAIDRLRDDNHLAHELLAEGLLTNKEELQEVRKDLKEHKQKAKGQWKKQTTRLNKFKEVGKLFWQR